MAPFVTRRRPRSRPAALALVLAGLLPPLTADRPASAAPACVGQAFGGATIDVPSVVVRPRFRLNGLPFPANGAAEFFLADRAHGFPGMQLALGRTDRPLRAIRLVPGRYDVVYAYRGGNGVPANAGATVGQVDALADGPLVIRAAMVALEVRKRHNGLPYAGTALASLRLVGRDGLGEVALGGMSAATVHTLAVPGSYDVEYTWVSGNGLPRNRHAVLRRLVLGAQGAQSVTIDVPSVVQRVDFRHNGAPFPASVYARGDLVLTRGADEEVRLGSSHQQSATVRIIPGAYAAHYRRVAGAGVVPVNADAVVATLRLDGAPAVLDVRSVVVRGDLRLNGKTPPASAYDEGRITLVTAAGDRAILGDTADGRFETRVATGTYDVAYERLAGGTVVPANTRTRFATGWKVQARPVRNLDVPAGTFAAIVRLDGAAFPGSVYEAGRIALLPLAGGDAVVLGDTTSSTHAVRLLPGRYRALFSRLAGGGIVPANVATPFGDDLVVRANGGAPTLPALLDVPAGRLEITPLHNGVGVADGLANGRLHLGWHGASAAVLGTLRDGAISRVLMPGRYDLYYESLGGGAALPANAFAYLGCWEIHP